MRYILAFLICMLSALSTGQDRLVSYTYLTNDNAYQSSVRQYIGYSKSMVIHPKDTTKPDRLLDITPMVGWRCYFFKGIENNYADLRTNIAYKHNRNWCVNFNTSFLSSKEWSPIFFDGFVRYSKKRISIESFYERETVGTPITNNLRYISESFGISADYRLARRLTMVNSIAYNSISDGNTRWYQTSRFIYTIGNSSYVDIKAKRMFGSDWSPYYFSPDYINQYNVGYGFYRPFNNGKLTTKLYAGLGFQEIDGYYMSMFNLDIKESTNFDSKWNADFIISTRNFNEYIYNTFTIKVYYTFGKKADTDK